MGPWKVGNRKRENSSADFFLGLSTAGTREEGQKIGKALVKAGLAACVNVIPSVTSFYYWEGKLCRDKEVIILIKTSKGNADKIIKNIKMMHKYSVPEIIFVRIEKGDKKYLEWVEQMVAQKAPKRGKKNIDNSFSKR